MDVRKFDFRINWVGTVLASLETSFSSIDEMANKHPWFDGLFQLEHAEAVFGISFVTAQAYILGTAQDVNNIRLSNSKKPVNKIKLYCDAETCSDTNTSKTTLINGIANYYKHHEEWGNGWPNNYTTTTLLDIGIDSSTKFPCYQAAVALFGENNAHKFSYLKHLISDWRQYVLSVYT